MTKHLHLRTHFRAIPVWMVVVAICIQPLFAFDSDCACGTSTATFSHSSLQTDGQSNVAEQSCCSEIEPQASCCGKQLKSSCCATEQQVQENPCSCNPDAMTCQCGDCECSVDDNSKAPLPVVALLLQKNTVLQYLMLKTVFYDLCIRVDLVNRPLG